MDIIKNIAYTIYVSFMFVRSTSQTLEVLLFTAALQFF